MFVSLRPGPDHHNSPKEVLPLEHRFESSFKCSVCSQGYERLYQRNHPYGVLSEKGESGRILIGHDRETESN